MANTSVDPDHTAAHTGRPLMLWLALNFPELALERFARDVYAQQACTQECTDRTSAAIVILENNRVSQANAAAVDCGIKPGCTLATAHSICAQLHYRARDLGAEQTRLIQLANALYQLSSHVSLQAPDTILLEISGSLRLFGAHTVLAEQARSICAEYGHTPTMGTASTSWAAIAYALSGLKQLPDIPLCQAGLHLADVPHTVIERLENMGIYTLGDLLKLPTAQLGQRFGRPLLRYLEQLQGQQPDPRPALHPAERFSEGIHFLQPMNDKNALCPNLKSEPDRHSPTKQLALELQHWLIARQLSCNRLRWTFHSHPGVAPVQMDVSFAHGQQRAEDMLRITHLKLEQTKLPAEVLGIHLSALETQSSQQCDGQLFAFKDMANGADTAATKQASLELIDELAARLGDAACNTIVSTDQHVPERAWQRQNITAIKGTPQALPDQTQRLRPIWLFKQPQPLARDELKLLQGPERIQGGWWQNCVARDYYIAQHRSGSECWAFTDENGNWYLHGYYS